jgi:hypothetical protein
MFPALVWSKTIHYFFFPFFFPSFDLFYGPLQTAQLTQCISEIERIEVKVNSRQEEGIGEQSQEFVLTIIQYQHVNKYSFVLANSNFLPHILQKCNKVSSCFFVLKSMLLFAALLFSSYPDKMKEAKPSHDL